MKILKSFLLYQRSYKVLGQRESIVGIYLTLISLLNLTLDSFFCGRNNSLSVYISFSNLFLKISLVIKFEIVNERVNEEISKSLKNGVKEIILTGVDLTSWTDSKYKSSKLGDLLDNIFKKNSSLFRLRLSSIDAAEIDDKLLYLVKNEPRLMPHFHFSLQSLDDLILKRMKRRHNVGQIINLFDIIRKARPHVTFGADFICGFPTESDSMFFNTIENVKKLNITHLHVFPYSSKHGTPASRMPQVDLYKRRKRAKILRELGKKNYVRLLKKEIKYKHNILIETFNGIGKTENNIKVKVNSSKKGDLIKTKLSSFNDDFLIL